MLRELLLLTTTNKLIFASAIHGPYSAQRHSNSVRAGELLSNNGSYKVTNNSTFEIQISPRDICGTERFQNARSRNGSLTNTSAAEYFQELTLASNGERRAMMMANLNKAASEMEALLNSGNNRRGLPSRPRAATTEDTGPSRNLTSLGLEAYLQQHGISLEQYLQNAKIDDDYLQRLRLALGSLPENNNYEHVQQELKPIERFFRSLARHLDLTLADLDHVWKTPSHFWGEMLEAELENRRVPQLPANLTDEKTKRTKHFRCGFVKASLAMLAAGVGGGIVTVSLGYVSTGIATGGMAMLNVLMSEWMNYVRDHNLSNKEANMLFFGILNIRDAIAARRMRRSRPYQPNGLGTDASGSQDGADNQPEICRQLRTSTPAEIEMTERIYTTQSIQPVTRAEVCEGDFVDWDQDIDWNEDSNYSEKRDDWLLLDDPEGQITTLKAMCDEGSVRTGGDVD